MDDLRIKAAHDLIAQERYADAFTIAAEAVTDAWEDPRALYLSAVALRHLGYIGVAAQIFRRALALDKNVNIWMHYAACMHDLHEYDKARDLFLTIHKQLPKDPMPLANISSGYIQSGRPQEAIEWANRALALEPDNYIARISKAFACLSLGKWEEGWQHAEYLYGTQLKIRVYNPPEREEPIWDGSPGKTVVVQCDQGLGDEIMFAQCLHDMAKVCKKVIVDCDPRLEGLFHRSFPECDVFGTRKLVSDLEWPSLYKIDARIHISWLGRYYRSRNEDFPRLQYIDPKPSAIAKWQRWLSQFQKPWVGISWKGGISATSWKARSIDLAEFAPILEQPGTFIDLSYKDNDLEVARWNIEHSTQIRKPPLDASDYDDTVALLAALDHVVTVTTTVAHACGAIGKRAWVLVPRAPQWRYGHGRSDVIWYPEDSLYLYRQQLQEKTMGKAIERMAEDYRHFIAPMTAAAA